LTLLLPIGLDIAACRVDYAEVVVEDLGDGRARLPSGGVLSLAQVRAAQLAAAWIARDRAGTGRRGRA
jgi:hypothetical protein